MKAKQPLGQNPQPLDELRLALAQLRDFTTALKKGRRFSAGEADSVEDVLFTIACLVRLLDPNTPKKERVRRKPWLAFVEVAKFWPRLNLTQTIDNFIFAACELFKKERRSGRVTWADDKHASRMGELVQAAKKEKLLVELRRNDRDWMLLYCNPELGLLHDRCALRQVDEMEKGWGVALFHDVWFRHRTYGTGTLLWFSAVKRFVERTEHGEFVDQLRTVSPTLIGTLRSIQKRRRLKTDRVRKRKGPTSERKPPLG